jgi:hypothetical protein
MFNPGFFGKNPPRWFLGQVALGQTVNKEDANGWGDRVKVRITGYDPAEGSLCADDDLRWAIIARPSTHGSLNKTTVAITGGEWVFGIFLDDENPPKRPMILGVLGRNDPSYEITGKEVESKKSSEFKRTLNWYKTVTPQVYHVLSKGSSSSKPTLPTKKEFGIKEK